MNTRQSLLTMSLVALVSLCERSAAQIIPRANLISTYTDNLFQSNSRQSAWINHAYIDLDYASSADLNLYYTGNASVFSDREELFNHTQSAGISWVQSDDEEAVLHAGGEISLRLDRPAYEYRDFLRADAFITNKQYLDDSLLARYGYSARLQEYINAEEYSFFEQSLSGQLSKFLPTQTTLQVRGELGLKSYLRSAGTVDLEETIEETTTLITVPVRGGSGRNLLQFNTRIKLAQSIDQYTGLQLAYRRKTNLAGQSRFSSEQLYNPDDDLFDDRYSYSGHEYRTTLKRLASAGKIFEFTARTARRRYTGRPALDLEGFLVESGETRQDTRNTLSLKVEKSVFPATLSHEIRLHVEWQYTDINSNDPYYNTDYQALSAGVVVDF